MPPTFFAETKDQRIVLVSSATGEVVRDLANVHGGGGANGFTLSPDGNTLFFTRGDGSCAAHIAKLDLTTGEQKGVISEGPPPDATESSVSVRPDGSAIAFAYYHCDTNMTDLVILPLDGSPQVVGAELGGPIGPRSWTPDGSRVIVVNNSQSPWVYTAVDVAPNGAITGHHPIISTPTTDCSFSITLVAPDSGQLIASKSCGAQGPTQETSIVELDANTAHVTRTLVEAPVGQALGPITIDSSGRYLLYGMGQSLAPDVVISDTNPEPPSHTWLLVDGASTPFPQADGYYGVSW